MVVSSDHLKAARRVLRRDEKMVDLSAASMADESAEKMVVKKAALMADK